MFVIEMQFIEIIHRYNYMQYDKYVFMSQTFRYRMTNSS